MKTNHLIIMAIIVLVLIYYFSKKTTTNVTSRIVGAPASSQPNPLGTTTVTSGWNNFLHTLGLGAGIVNSIAPIARTTKGYLAPQPTLEQLGAGSAFNLNDTSLGQLPLTNPNDSILTSIYDPNLDPTVGYLPLTDGITGTLEPLPAPITVDQTTLDSSSFDYSNAIFV